MRYHGALLAFVAVHLFPSDVPAIDVSPDSLPPVRLDCSAIERASDVIRHRIGNAAFDRYIQLMGVTTHDERGVTTVTLRRADLEWDGRTRGDFDPRPEVWYETTWRWRTWNYYYDFSFDIDTAGRLLGDPRRLRIPDCTVNPDSCSRLVPHEEAIRVASTSGLPSGKAHIQGFGWLTELERLVWSVVHNSFIIGREERPTTHQFIIDALSGEILLVEPWAYRTVTDIR